MDHTVTIRRSNPGDAAAIHRIAALDSGHAPAGDAMLALVAGELRAVLDWKAPDRASGAPAS